MLIAVRAWTLYVWITRIFIMAGQDESTGFKVVHGDPRRYLHCVGLAAGWIGRVGCAPVGDVGHITKRLRFESRGRNLSDTKRSRIESVSPVFRFPPPRFSVTP